MVMILALLTYMHIKVFYFCSSRVCGGHDRMIAGLTTTCAISTYHHWCCEFESRSERDVPYYVIKFVSDLQQVPGFLWVLRFPPLIKLTTMI